MLYQIGKGFSISAELGLVELASKKLGNGFILINSPDFFHTARQRCKLEHATGKGGSPQEWQRNQEQEAGHENQLDRDDLMQGRVEHVNTRDDGSAESQLQPTDVAYLAGNLEGHEHDSQGINPGAQCVQDQQ